MYQFVYYEIKSCACTSALLMYAFLRTYKHHMTIIDYIHGCYIIITLCYCNTINYKAMWEQLVCENTHTPNVGICNFACNTHHIASYSVVIQG